jgi:hypothetical protein
MLAEGTNDLAYFEKEVTLFFTTIYLKVFLMITELFFLQK